MYINISLIGKFIKFGKLSAKFLEKFFQHTPFRLCLHGLPLTGGLSHRIRRPIPLYIKGRALVLRQKTLLKVLHYIKGCFCRAI